jgi:hypothetical protein
MISLTIFNAVRGVPLQPVRALAATIGRSPTPADALVANDASSEKMVPGRNRA